MISINDYIDVNGKIDWTSYSKAQDTENKNEIDNGKYCYQCNTYIFHQVGYKTLCYSCDKLRNQSDEVSHHSFIRCPFCSHLESSFNYDLMHLYDEGEHEIYCSNCNDQFEISTSVSYSFRSPKLKFQQQDD